MLRKTAASFFSVVAIALFLSACGGGQSGTKQISDQNNIDKIQQGVTTKSEILALFGKPSGISKKSGGVEEWSYDYSNYDIKPATYVPFVGLFAGGSTSQTSSLIVTFDNKNVVSEYSTNGSSSDSSLGNKAQ